MPKVDGYLQLMPFIRQPKTLLLKAGVDVDKLFPESAHRTHCLLEEFVAYNTAPARELQRTAKPILHAEGCWGSLRLPACPWQGAGGWLLPRHPPGLGGCAGWRGLATRR